SAALREKLRAGLAKHVRTGRVSLGGTGGSNSDSVLLPQPRVSRALPADVPIIVLANEFFDALPIEILSAEGALRINSENGRLVESWARASEQELEFLDRYGLLPEPGERVEVPIFVQPYILQVGEVVKNGFVVVIDYGYTRQELFAGRHRHTLMAYRQ